jgi:hypothetical protein
MFRNQNTPAKTPLMPPVRALTPQELASVAGGYLVVVKGDDGSPGCAVFHPGLPPSLFV